MAASSCQQPAGQFKIPTALHARHLRKGATHSRAALETARDLARILLAQPAARVIRAEGNATFPPDDPRPVAVFSHFEATGDVSDATLAYLTELRTVASAIVFVTTSGDLTRVRDHADLAILRANVGYDFGSWKVGLAAASQTIATRGVILANDSVLGPRRPFRPIFDRMGSTPFWGMTNSHELAPHLQSYFLVATPSVTSARWFRHFWRRLRHLPNAYKYLVVRCYEVGLSQLAQANGLQPTAAFPVEQLAPPGTDLTTLNPTQNFWRELATSSDFPFLKKGMRRPENRERFDAHDIDDVIQTEF